MLLSVLPKLALPNKRKNEDGTHQPSSHQSHLVQTSRLAPADPSKPAASPPESAAPLSSDQSPSDPDPQSLVEAKTRSDWPKWQKALQAEYASLRKHNIFDLLESNLPTKPIGFRLIFTKKKNNQGVVVRYKVRLVAQDFTQRPGVDFSITYSLVMDSGTFCYLLGMVVHHTLEIHLLDIVTAYLYGPLDATVYISPPPDFLPGSLFDSKHDSYSRLRLQKALYGLKQSGRMWYQYLREFLLHHKFQTDQALPCVFTLREKNGFVIIAIYVNDLNLVGTRNMISHTIALLTTKFEMKDLDKTTFCLGLQVTHVPTGGILLHQTTYTRSLLKRFEMDQAVGT